LLLFFDQFGQRVVKVVLAPVAAKAFHPAHQAVP